MDPVLLDMAFLRQIGNFFDGYGGEKIILGVVAAFWLLLTRPLGRNGGIYSIKTLNKSATVE